MHNIACVAMHGVACLAMYSIACVAMLPLTLECTAEPSSGFALQCFDFWAIFTLEQNISLPWNGKYIFSLEQNITLPRSKKVDFFQLDK